MTGRANFLGLLVLGVAVIASGLWIHSKFTKIDTQQGEVAKELGEVRKLLETTGKDVASLSQQIKDQSEQRVAVEKGTQAALEESSKKIDELQKKVDNAAASASDASLVAKRSLDAATLSFGGIAYLMDATSEPSSESRSPVAFSAVTPGSSARGMKIDGAGGRDIMNISEAGPISIDGVNIVSIEQYKLANGKPNEVSILAPGLNNLEDNWLEIEHDPKLDHLFLDACLNWKQAKVGKDKVDWTATDKDNQTRKVTVAAAATVEVSKVCDNRYAFAVTRKDFPETWYKKARELEAQLKSDLKQKNQSLMNLLPERKAPEAKRRGRNEEEIQPYTPDDAGNIARYKKWAETLPIEAQKSLSILISLMERGQMDTEFATNKVVIEPLNFDTVLIPVTRITPEFNCSKDRWKERRGGLPMIIVGDGLDMTCKSGDHFVFSGDKDDRLEFGNWDFNVIAPGKGNDTIKAQNGGSITILESRWGHKKFDNTCNYPEGEKRGPAYVYDAPVERFGGVGLKYSISPEGAVVKQVMKHEAAENSGIVEGDIIVSVDDKPLAGVASEETAKLIRGRPGTNVKLTYRKPDKKETQSVVLTRKILQVQTRGEYKARHRIDYKPRYPHENYIVFASGVSPADMKEEPRGKWTNTKTGDTIEIPHCFNLVYADEPAEQAKARVANTATATEQRLGEEKERALTEPALQTLKAEAARASSCAAAPTSAKDVLLRYPVIIQGKFNQDKSFSPSKVYKGFREWPTGFTQGGFEKIALRPDKTALVLADFTMSGASIRCGAVLYETDSINDLSFASILAEAVVYEAGAKSRIEAAKGETERRRNSQSVPDFLRENGDYLALMEMSVGELRNGIERMNARKDPYDHFRSRLAGRKKKDERCGFALQDSILTQNMKETLNTAKEFRGSGGEFHRALQEIGTALINIGAYEDAMYTLCGTGAENSYIEAVLKAGKKEVLSGVKLERAGALKDMDLSGLTLRKLGVWGEWKNVKVTGTDLTNAKFEDAKFENVNLADAKVDFATYDCKTKFPEGFDPVARHMVPVWRDRGCDENAIPKVDLSNMTVKPFHDPNLDWTNYQRYSEADHERMEYDQIELHRLQLDGVKAQNSSFGRIMCGACKIKNGDFTGSRFSLWQGGNGAAQFTDTSFKNADLRGSDINTATFTNVDFAGANLAGVDLHGTKLKNVNFKGANIEGTDFKRAQYDAATVFPEGFDPEKAGMTKFTE